jgi:phosphatidylglycerophosphate synthase
MLANSITLARLPLLAVCLAILYRGSPPVRIAGAALLLVGLLLDTIDGVVARKRGETSLAGSVLDIAADRIYELALWMAFAHLDLIPAAIPLIVLTRTALTDAFRSLGVAEGTAPLAQEHGRLGRFLVASTWMRTGYALTKISAFCGLALGQAGYPALLPVANAVAWLAVALCLARGAPAILEGLRALHAPPPPARVDPLYSGRRTPAPSDSPSFS